MKTYHDIAADGGSDVIGQVAEQMARLQDRLAQVDHVVAVMSGKGGVGKSTVTAVLSEALTALEYRIGVVDADINGPSMARMTGVRRHTPIPDGGGMQPAVSATGVKVMSMDLFLPQDATAVLWHAPTQNHAYTWRPMVEMAALRELIADTAWGTLDIMLADLPPGSDRLPNLADLVPDLSGAVVVTGPTAVSQMVVARSITAATQVADVPLIGIVENMATYRCPSCGHQERFLAPASGGESLGEAHGIPFLGRIPFDPRLALAADDGEPFLARHADSPAGHAIMALAARIQHYLYQ